MVFDVGELLAGKYRVDRVLGKGGMGMVVAATHVHLGQQVALKLLLDRMASDETLVERFVREARASAQLRGEHVCRVSDVDTLDDGSPYMVMELLAGRDLASLVAETGPLPIAVAVDYALQASIGIAEAHARGIIHRDLKPANLFLTTRPDGTSLIKVLDFGIAKATKQFDHTLTQDAAMIGSPGYMSPEQLRSARDVDVRTDIWALGVILFELIGGRLPFAADSFAEMVIRVTMEPPAPLGVVVPPQLEAVIQSCLDKDPAKRFQNVAQLARALASFGGPHANELATAVARVLANADRPPEITAPSVASATTTLSAAAGVTEVGRAKPRWAVLAGAAVLVLVGVLVALVATTGTGVAESPGSVIAPAVAAPPPPQAPPAAVPIAAPVAAPVVAPAVAADAAIATPSGSAAPAIKPRKPKKVPGTTKPTEDYDESRF